MRPAMAERLELAKRAIAALATIDELFTAPADPRCICSRPYGGEHEHGCPAGDR